VFLLQIVEGFTIDDDLIEFVCPQCGFRLGIPRFMVAQFEEDNIFEGKDPSVPPEPYCQKCPGILKPVSYTGIRGVHYEFKK
jgi:hypothetical protein